MKHAKNPRSGFTMTEALLVIAVIAVLVALSVVVLNPADIIKQSRDSTRFSDLAAIHRSLSLIQADQPSAFFGATSTVYVSLPSESQTCEGHSLPSLPSGWSYNCEPEATYRNIDGTGWVPADFTAVSFAPPPLLQVLPVDPINRAEEGLYYAYAVGSWHLAAGLESEKYSSGGRDDRTSTNGIHPNSYEIGRDTTIIPIDLYESSVEVADEVVVDPTLGTSSSSLISETSATLQGSLDDLGSFGAVDAWFQWRMTGSSDWNSSLENPTRISSSATGFSWEITNLSAGVTYEFRAVARGVGGENLVFENPLVTFTTAGVANACGGANSISHNGNSYQLVAIGDQCWFADNLVVDNGCSDLEWQNNQGCGYHNNDTAQDNGLLYQWSAAMAGSETEGAQGLCPAGYHIPTDVDYNALISFLGDANTAGAELKVGGSSDYNALMAGRRTSGGDFTFFNTRAYFWTSTTGDTGAWAYYIDDSSSGVTKFDYPLGDALSVRCLLN